MSNVSQGDVVAGRYRLIAPLGHGGMGVVYKALDLTLARVVAIKIFREKAADVVARPPVAQEARTLASLQHPNVVALYDAGVEDDCSYLVTEFIEGRSLSDILHEGEPLDPDYALEIVAQIGLALAFMHHQGLTHRDIKPANILVCKSGRALLSDFGLAAPFSDATLTAGGTVYGTPKYMSPEQAMARPLDGRSDIYSLAVVLYEALSGQSWSPGDVASPADVLKRIVERPLAPIRQLNPTVSNLTENILERALAKHPDARFSSADEFVRALRSAQSREWDPADSRRPARNRSLNRATQAHDGSAIAANVGSQAESLRRAPWQRSPFQLLAICIGLVFPLIVLAVNRGTFAGTGIARTVGTWPGSAFMLFAAICCLVLVGVRLQFQRRVRAAGYRLRTDVDLVSVDDLASTASVTPYSSDTVRRLDEFDAIWNQLSVPISVAKDKFVAAAEKITYELLREALGCRIERPIPYLRGTVGYLVDAPFLWTRLSRFPILFIAYEGPHEELLSTVVQQLEIAKATEYFALLIIVPQRN